MVKFGLVEWINKYGKISIKMFTNKNEMDAFVERLKARNAKYVVTY